MCGCVAYLHVHIKHHHAAKGLRHLFHSCLHVAEDIFIEEVGGWVGGWVDLNELVEEIEAVGMSCCCM